MITYKRIKEKKEDTKEKAEEVKATLESLVKNNESEFQNVFVDEKNRVKSEKIIFTKEEIIEDIDVDSTMIVLCDHDENGVATEGGSKLVTCEEARKFFDERTEKN